ncbi:FtsX-like permease family protein [Candidatus Saccharibacteria bacterium]|nr:FtsX-like permease family protein [Candidatus Saccharibacteria bacterium]
MSVIARGIRNAFRNVVRTISLVVIIGLSVGLALTMLVSRQAIDSKIASIKSSIGNTITISAAGSRGFQGGGNPLTETQLAPVSSLAHVTSVTLTLNDRLSSTETNLVSSIDPGTLGRRFGGGNGGGPGGPFGASGSSATTTFVLPVTVTGTNTVGNATLSGGAGGGGTLNVTSGTTIDASKDANVALIGTALATKNNLKVGSTFTAYGATFTVSGIYDAGNTFSNAGVIMPLSTVQRLSSQVGDVTSATVTVDSVANLDSTSSAISTKLGSAADVTSSQSSATAAITPLENIRNITVISLIGAVVAGAVIILLTMLMIVRERRREIGVLKAIGSSNVKVVGQFMSEAVTFTLLGSVVGLVIGVFASSSVTKLLATSATSTTTMGGFGGGAGRALRAAGLGRQNLTALHAAVGWDILFYGLAAAILIALIGSAIPALMISKVRPSEVMRAE